MLDVADDEPFAMVDKDVEVVLYEGEDAWTKSFKLVDDVGDEREDVFPEILEFALVAKFVLLVDAEAVFDIGTCLTVIVVPEGIFLVRFLFH